MNKRAIDRIPKDERVKTTPIFDKLIKLKRFANVREVLIKKES